MLELNTSTHNIPPSHEERLEIFRNQAAGLACIRRWNGVCEVTVTQHCVQACDLVSAQAAGYALLHDIEEFDTGDIITPVKNTLRRLGVWQRFVIEIVLPIRRHFTLLAGIDWSWRQAVLHEVHEIDQHLKATEYRDCVDPSLVRLSAVDLAEPFDEYMQPWIAIKAERVFMDRVGRVLPALGGCDAG